MTDYCTLWPDRLFGVDYSQCCLQHDLAYLAGLPRIEADLALGLCVAESGLPIIGVLMALATMAFGWFFYRRNRNV